MWVSPNGERQMWLNVDNLLKCNVCQEETREDLYTLQLKEKFFENTRRDLYPRFHKSCFKKMSGEHLDKYLTNGMPFLDWWDYIGT